MHTTVCKLCSMHTVVTMYQFSIHTTVYIIHIMHIIHTLLLLEYDCSLEYKQSSTTSQLNYSYYAYIATLVIVYYSRLASSLVWILASGNTLQIYLPVQSAAEITLYFRLVYRESQRFSEWVRVNGHQSSILADPPSSPSETMSSSRSPAVLRQTAR